MAEFAEVVKQRNRMCKSFDNYEDGCKGCSMKKEYCERLDMINPELLEEKVMKWATEHPIKTNADKFEEMFGVKVVKGVVGCNGIDFPCDKTNDSCNNCKYNGFWNQEYKEIKF